MITIADTTAASAASAASAAAAAERYRRALDSGLSLDMTRGKPCPEQLDLANGMLSVVGPGDFLAADGADCRNYGGVDGLPEARRLFGDFLEVPAKNVLVQDNSSLRLMHDALVQAMLRGVPGGAGPWVREPKVRFLCPVPGYDRHFSICERLGIEMVPVRMDDAGPDLDTVTRLVAEDPAVRGMICVPRYSNPTGITYSAEAVEVLASMPTKAADFRIIWDNAYAVHHLVDDPPPLASIFDHCQSAGNPDRPLIFGSTSKVSFGGAGVAMVAASDANVAWLRRGYSRQTVGPDKLNQLRHVRFFRDIEGIRAHMRRHAEILRPKFDRVCRVLEQRLGGLELATFRKPAGGYFISLDLAPGCALRVVDLAKAAGLLLTPAGATYPGGNDPEDRNLRLAPSFPSLQALEQAANLIADCAILAASEVTVRL